MGGGVIFNGYFNVDNTSNNVIQDFYYIYNNQYVDILLPAGEKIISDNIISDNIFTTNFTYGGTVIRNVIPYFNQSPYNNPYKLNLNSTPYINYNPTSAIGLNWVGSKPVEFTFTFTLISGLSPLSIPRPFSMNSLFSNNSQVYYKPHSLSTGSGGVKNYRKKQRRT